MTFSLVICTYMRPQALLKLLESVNDQLLYPNQIVIVDGSTNNKTKEALEQNSFDNLEYHKVSDEQRGLTKQRNIGVNLVQEHIDVICFLDDDTVLKPDFFKHLIETYTLKPDALAIGGYIINEANWFKADTTTITNKHFALDGWARSEPLRYRLRSYFGLLPDTAPGHLPTFSHGRPINFLPPSGKIYPVEQIMGGVASYKKEIFKTLNFSTYFEGYGLYEDTDFSLRLSKIGKLYVNSAAQLYHYHDHSGRPNKYKYGKMVIRNGWYVWRVKYPKVSLKARIKWNATAFLLTLIRFSNAFNSDKKYEAFTEALGRVTGWFSLFFNRPKITDK